MYEEQEIHDSAMNVASTRPSVTIYSDGSYKPQIDFGGYGSIMVCGRNQLICYGGVEGDTNNRMELLGVINSLRRLTEPCDVLVVSDSQYVINGMNGYVFNWAQRDWRTSQGKPIANRDLWEEMLCLMQYHNIHCQWVKGHAGHPANEQCDRLATLGAYNSANMPVPASRDQMYQMMNEKYPGAQDDEIVTDISFDHVPFWKRKK